MNILMKQNKQKINKFRQISTKSAFFMQKNRKESNMDRFNIRRLDGYTIMSNHHLRDQKLSHAARGLLSFMLSLPENWDYSFNGLVAISKEGKSAVRIMINELKQAKYIKISFINFFCFMSYFIIIFFNILFS